MPASLKFDDKMVQEAVKLGNFKTKQEALNAALAEFVQRHNRLRILELADKIDFDPAWDYKKMRGKRCLLSPTWELERQTSALGKVAVKQNR